MSDTAVFRDNDREMREGTSAVRGTMFGLLFSIPLWALVIGGIVAGVTSAH